MKGDPGPGSSMNHSSGVYGAPPTVGIIAKLYSALSIPSPCLLWWSNIEPHKSSSELDANSNCLYLYNSL